MAYTVPTAAELKVRYVAFASVENATVDYWITDAQRFVGTDWIEGDYGPGLMALAAHNMALEGYGTDAAAIASVPAGVTRMKSGSFEMGFTEAAANARAAGSLESTRYGQKYAALLKSNRGGLFIQPTGVVPYDDCCRFPQGEA